MSETNKKNIMEDIIDDLFERLLALRFDICRCELCRRAMFDMVLNKFPPEYVERGKDDYRERFVVLSNKYFRSVIEEISKAINYVNKNPPHKIDIDREGGFNQLIERIYQDRGLDFSQYHRSLLKRRVALRLRANKLNSYTEYLTVLAENPYEYEKLFEVLTINVSEFFRDKHVWDGIEKLLRRLLVHVIQHQMPLKIWSAGCANGEEPYSLAILIKEINASKPIEIYGTDIDADSVSTARRGIYQKNKLKNVAKPLLEKYFVPLENDQYILKDEIKKMVHFKRHDLINDIILPEVDILICRNVFIYFTKPLQEQILNKFYHALKEKGYLIIGQSESILSEARLIFKDVDLVSRIYQKTRI